MRLLSGFLTGWTPSPPFVDADVEAPADGACPAIAKSAWDGIPGSATDGKIVDQAIHARNIAIVVQATQARTAEQAVSAYLDDRRCKNASLVEGLEPFSEIWRDGAKQVTTITSVPADATTVRYEDGGTIAASAASPTRRRVRPAIPTSVSRSSFWMRWVWTHRRSR